MHIPKTSIAAIHFLTMWKQPPSVLLHLFFFFLFIVVIFSSGPQPATSRVAHNNLTDLESLLAFKDGISDPDGFIATNWTTDAAFCDSWFGVECSRRRQRVVKLYMYNFSLQGTVSPYLGNLSFLSYLDLSHNNLTGPIPSSIGRLPRLTILVLESNHLFGSIPSSIFNMSSLSEVYLATNKLTGPILPPNYDIFMLPRLQEISLSYNSLTGSIPLHFAHYSQLQILSLSYNELSGSVPPELGNITGLQVLYLGSNQLGGTIPASIGNLTMLQQLGIGNNYMEGSIPEELGKLLHLERLQLFRNNLTGSIPAALFNTSNLEIIDLSRNKLNGIIPPTLGNSWPHLTHLLMYDNQLTGGLDFIASFSNCRNLFLVEMDINKLDGVLPYSIGNLSTTLSVLYLSNNYIKGKIPAGIGNLSGLSVLLLAENVLTGEVPQTQTLLKMKSLQGIDLAHNRLSGNIPIDLGVITGLNRLTLSHNALSGSIPYSLGNITSLQYLYLDSNILFSKIPESLWNLSGLLELNLSHNTIDGLLPPQMKNFLDKLDLSKNRFTGNISSALGELQMLRYLNLSNNSFYGQIPISLKGLISIEYLDLSYNTLSGTIPESLANLSYLHILDLSFNKLEGQIPQGGVFSNHSKISLKGNTALCGAILLGFPSCPSNVGTSHSKSKVYLLKYILPPIATVAILACLYVVLVSRQQSSSKLELDTPLNGFRIISYNELVQATDHFSDANLLGRGSFGSVFKAYLHDGSITAVKVMNIEDQDALRSFDVECNVLGQVRHRNLVKIINTCSNLDFKALVLEFMPNGSLEQWLYSHENYLNLLQRLNIMVDVSLALEYLHHDHPQIIVHRDLKPSNVLLDENMTAHVSDFGISKLLLGDSKSMLSTSAPGTFGYMAPEYVSTGRISRKSDVYSFGILLLETLTRKKPGDDIFNEGLSLRQWVSEAYPGAVLEIVDSSLLTDDCSSRRDDCSSRREPDPLINVHECISSLIELGLQCSSNSPKERMSIKHVVPTIQNIRMKYLSE